MNNVKVGDLVIRLNPGQEIKQGEICEVSELCEDDIILLKGKGSIQYTIGNFKLVNDVPKPTKVVKFDAMSKVSELELVNLVLDNKVIERSHNGVDWTPIQTAFGLVFLGGAYYRKFVDAVSLKRIKEIEQILEDNSRQVDVLENESLDYEEELKLLKIKVS